KAWGDPGTDQVPDHVMIQVQEQLAVEEDAPDEADVAVLFDGRSFELYPVRRHDVLIASIVERTQAFWQRVLERRPPEPDWSAGADSLEVLKAMYRPEEGSTIYFDAAVTPWVDQYRAAAEAEAQAKDAKKEAQARIIAIMRQAQLGICPDGTKIKRSLVNM